MIAPQKCLVWLWYMIHTPSFSSLGVVYQEWEVEYPQTSFLEIVNGNILTRKFCEKGLCFTRKFQAVSWISNSSPREMYLQHLQMVNFYLVNENIFNISFKIRIL